MSPSLAPLTKPETLSATPVVKRHLFLICTKVPCEPEAALITLGWRSWEAGW